MMLGDKTKYTPQPAETNIYRDAGVRGERGLRLPLITWHSSGPPCHDDLVVESAAHIDGARRNRFVNQSC